MSTRVQIGRFSFSSGSKKIFGLNINNVVTGLITLHFSVIKSSVKPFLIAAVLAIIAQFALGPQYVTATFFVSFILLIAFKWWSKMEVGEMYGLVDVQQYFRSGAVNRMKDIAMLHVHVFGSQLLALWFSIWMAQNIPLFTGIFAWLLGVICYSAFVFCYWKFGALRKSLSDVENSDADEEDVLDLDYVKQRLLTSSNWVLVEVEEIVKEGTHRSWKRCENVGDSGSFIVLNKQSETACVIQGIVLDANEEAYKNVCYYDDKLGANYYGLVSFDDVLKDCPEEEVSEVTA